MIRTAVIALFALLASVVVTLSGQGNPTAVMHVAFAIGVLPLIFAAISHFVPVLTRSREPTVFIAWLPSLAQLIGLLAVAVLLGWLPRPVLLSAVAFDGLLALVLLVWAIRRARQALGSPHSAWRWYGVALLSFLLALLAIAMQFGWPEHYHRWRSVHLHLNTLGLLGFAALGTLPVLLPTAMGRPDPNAARWLRSWLLPLTCGLCLVVLAVLSDQGELRGALNLLAVALYASATLSLARQWFACYGLGEIWRDGAAASLLLALLGLCLMIFAGSLHGFGWLPARPGIAAWFASFLLPLVSGALSQLLPVWRFPGPSTAARVRWREILVGGGQWRACAFVLAGMLFLAGQTGPAALLAMAGLLWFAGNLLRACFTTE